MGNSFTIPSIFTAIDRFSRPVRQMKNSVQSFVAASQIGLARTERAFRSLMMPVIKLNRVLMGLGLYVGLYSLIRVVENVVKTMADFEQAQVNISAVTGKTIGQNKALSDQARDIAVRYGVAAKSISELQYELIKLGGLDVLSTTEAATRGAIGLEVKPEDFALMVGAVMKSYGDAVDKDGNRLVGTVQQVVDQLVKISDITALDGSTLMTMMPNALAAASEAKIPFADLLAMFGAARDEMLQTASSSTALKNIFIDNAVRGKELATRLAQITNNANSLKKAYQFYNKRSAQTALVVAGAKERGDLEKYVKILNSMETAGYAEERAQKQLVSMTGKAKLAKVAFGELVFGIDDGQGALSAFIKETLDTVRAMSFLAVETDAGRKALAAMNPKIVETAKRYLFWTKVIGYLIGALIAAKLAMWAWAIVIGVAQVALALYNVGLGISVALGLANIITLKNSAFAMGAYKVAVGLATAAQWLWNAAISANPIALAIIAMGYLAYEVYKTKKAYDSLTESVQLANGMTAIPESQREPMTVVDKIDKGFSDAFQQYINGPVSSGLKAIANKTGIQWVDNLANALKPSEFFRTRDYAYVNQNRMTTKEPVAEKVNMETEKQDVMKQIFEVFGKSGKVDFSNVPFGTTFSGDSIGKKDYVMPKVGSTFE